MTDNDGGDQRHLLLAVLRGQNCCTGNTVGDVVVSIQRMVDTVLARREGSSSSAVSWAIALG